MHFLRIGGIIAVSVMPLAIAASAARHELLADFRPAHSVPVRPAVLAHQALEDVSFEASGETLRGWFIPSSNRAAILLLHGSDADRTQLSREADMLARHGYGVLLFDSLGHGSSGGAVTWGAGERVALDAALNFVTRKPGIDADRVGVFAFSMGTMIAIQVAARDPRIAALVVEGAFADPDEEVRHEFRHWGALSQWPALWTAHWLGMKDDLRPKDLIGAIAPRPIFVISGTADAVVTPDQSRTLFDAARQPKSWWLVDGATHFTYPDAGGSAYQEKLTAFYDDALLRKEGSSATR